MSQGRASEKFQVSKTTVWRRLKRMKQLDPDQRNSENEIDRQNVKIEVVDNITGDHLPDTYDEGITMRYAEDGDLRYVDTIDGQNSEERTLDCETVSAKYANLSGTEKLLQNKDAGQAKMGTEKHVSYEVVPESSIVQSEGQNIVIASSQSSFIDSKHLGIFTSEGHMIPTGEQLTITQDNKVVPATEGSRENAGNTQFELEMPLMNLPGGGYQVVGSEIVIGGQQMVVLEPSGSNPHHPTNSDHHLVVASFSQMDGLDDLSKVERTVSVENLETENQQVEDMKQDGSRSQQNSD